MSLIKNHVKTLRESPTVPEQYLWTLLRAKRFNGYKFRRQHLIHPYIVDFICLKEKLIIELDGGQHNEQQEYDARRTRFLEDKGYRVLRFWNVEILEEIGLVLEVIFGALEGG